MTYQVLTLYNRSGKILGWWYGDTVLEASGHVVNLIGEDPTNTVNGATPKLTFEHYRFAVRHVNLKDWQGTEKTVRYVIVPRKLNDKFWKQKQAIRWTGEFDD